MADENNSSVVEMTADIVSAIVSNNQVKPEELPAVIRAIYDALGLVGSGKAQPEPTPLIPAVPIKKSVQPDAIVCLEDGRRFKSLKRHLRTRYDMSPDEYRAKWGLPRDYPMVAPSYAAARSALAKAAGLGQGRRKPAAPAAQAKRRRKAAAG